ncbi:MAG: response regulator [Desulfuromusa sp.]|jgi:DNA-binding NtrC family response regulator|nr:response regulator [Desulfuromusa sp.]
MNHKIIFVDDEVNILKALKRDMTMADIDAEYFTSAEDALVYLSQHQIDIVVSDFCMPEMNGVTFLKEVQISYPDIYRVILSSCGVESSELNKALKSRTVEQCFAKPWDVNELLAYFERFKDHAQHSFI